jgi:hypothetical protein
MMWQGELMRRLVLVSCVALAAAAYAQAQAAAPSGAASSATVGPGPAARAEVLVLGVYHMANPGRDIFNMKADDVLAPKRQAEIAELIAVLKSFAPTKVAVEADFWSEDVAKRYGDYLAGRHELSRNETEQVGFRLAKEAGHESVYPVDVDGEFPYLRLMNYAKGAGRGKEIEVLQAEVGAMVKAQDEYLASHSILQTLLYMNADEKVASDVGFYYRQAHLGEPGDWAGPDLVAEWFRRNVRIYANIAGLARSPNERVLAIFGAGHLGWLRQNVANDPTLRLRKLAELVP